MPTGYTADVKDGKVTEFKNFALQCARAFGALVEMRDEPADKPIPEKFEATSYYSERAAKTEQEIAEINGLTEAETDAKAKEAFDAAVASRAAREKRRLEECARYEAMREKVRAWSPPSKDHEGLKQFMVEQLDSSIKFDCAPPSKSWDPEPTLATGAQWKAAQLTELDRSLAYSREEHRKEIERAAGRTGWVKALRESLA